MTQTPNTPAAESIPAPVTEAPSHLATGATKTEPESNETDTKTHDAEAKLVDDARKESAKYRKRAQDAEADRDGMAEKLRAARLQLVHLALGQDEVSVDALVAAGFEPDLLVGDDGQIDTEKLRAIARDTKTKFNIVSKLNHIPTSGMGSATPQKATWADAIRNQ